MNTGDVLWTIDSLGVKPRRVCGISGEIAAGRTAILGGSGAGKTSLLNVLAGFESPDSGSVRAASGLRVAWSPQHGGLWHPLTVREHLQQVGASPSAIEDGLAGLELSHAADRRPGTLSGGERGRLSVLRALLAASDVLLLDEPFAHTDGMRLRRCWEYLRHSLQRTPRFLVFTTHDPAIVLREADRVWCLENGLLTHAGSATGLYNDPPNPRLMDFLGPGNWLTPAEAAVWLQLSMPEGRCFRPETLHLWPDPQGAFVVETAYFEGAVEEVRLSRIGAAPEDGVEASRIFFHRPTRPIALSGGVGARVALVVRRGG